MKIQCDVCRRDGASVFCVADEAALCHNCDSQVHNANKLAGKHLRFSLLNPQVNESPSCDVCQERKALLFCKEDRALLCRECDSRIHRANELTKKHSRFLLIGIKLSAASSTVLQSEPEIKTNEEKDKQSSTGCCSEASSDPWRVNNESSRPQNQQGPDSTGTISDYLMDTLPGWQAEDLMDPYSHYGFCKNYEHTPLFTNDEYRSTFNVFSYKDMLPMCLPCPSGQTSYVRRKCSKHCHSMLCHA